MPSLSVLGADGKPTGTVELSDAFGGPVRVPLLHQGIVRELADRRVGTHDTKGRSEVSGGGRKPWRQKGTGRARQGSIRAPNWKGGGKVFGPTPRSYDKDMPTAMRRGALRDAFVAKIADGSVMVVEQFAIAEPRTKVLTARLKSLGVEGVPTLVVVAERSATLERAARNIPWVEVETAGHTSAYQVMRHTRMVVERTALLALHEALGT